MERVSGSRFRCFVRVCDREKRQMLFSESEDDTLGNVSQGLAIVSFVICMLVVIAVLLVPTLRDGERFQLIATMCFCSALFESTYIFGKNRTSENECRIFGPLDQAGSIGVVVWNFIMSMELYITIARKPVKEKSCVYKCFSSYPAFTKHIFAWILVLILTVIPLIADEYGKVGQFCWIESNRSNSDAYRFIFFYAPLWIVIVWESFVYLQIFSVFRTLRQQGLISGVHAIHAKKILSSLGMYPLILIATWLFGTMNRLQNSIEPDEPKYWLYMAQAITMHLQGFLFGAVFFIYDSRARNEMYDWFTVREWGIHDIEADAYKLEGNGDDETT